MMRGSRKQLKRKRKRWKTRDRDGNNEFQEMTRDDEEKNYDQRGRESRQQRWQRGRKRVKWEMPCRVETLTQLIQLPTNKVAALLSVASVTWFCWVRVNLASLRITWRRRRRRLRKKKRVKMGVASREWVKWALGYKWGSGRHLFFFFFCLARFCELQKYNHSLLGFFFLAVDEPSGTEA